MFGSQKRKEKQEAARLAVREKLSGVLTELQGEFEGIQKTADCGEKLIALDAFTQKSTAALTSNLPETLSPSFGAGLGVLLGSAIGGASVIGGAAILLGVPALICLAPIGILTMKPAQNVLTKRYDKKNQKTLNEFVHDHEMFFSGVQKLLAQTATDRQEIVTIRLDDLGHSRIRDKIFDTYPDIAASFAKAAARKPPTIQPVREIPKPPMQSQQGFTL